MRIINSTEHGDGLRLFIRDGEKKIIRDISPVHYSTFVDNSIDNGILEYLSDKVECEVSDYSNNYKIILFPDRRSQNYASKVLSGNDIPLYEPNISLTRRWMLETQTKIGDEPYKYLFFDIETDDTKNDIVIGRDEILSCCMIDGDGLRFEVISRYGEKHLLEHLISIFKQYDVLIAWNSSRNEGFDIPYLRARCEHYGIEVDWKEWQILDAMFLYAGGWAKLDTVGEKQLGMKKLPREKIIDMYNNDKIGLLKYNMRDVEIMYELEKKMGILGLKEALSQTTNLFLEELRYNSFIVDNLILWKVKELDMDYKFPYEKYEKTEKFKGAFVKLPPAGLHENVIVIDFSSLYNRLIQAFHICPLTLGGGDVTIPESNITFAHGGLVPQILEEFEKMRNKYKAEMLTHRKGSELYNKYFRLQYAVKTILLSFYGVMGSPSSRYFRLEIAETITWLARYFIIESMKYVEENTPYEVLYCDTDSIFIKLNTDDIHKQIEMGEKVVNDLNKFYDVICKRHNAKLGKIDMKFEKIYSKIIFSGTAEKAVKKRYCGYIIAGE